MKIKNKRNFTFCLLLSFYRIKVQSLRFLELKNDNLMSSLKTLI